MNTDSRFSEKEFDAKISELLKAENQAKAPVFFTENVMNRVRQEKPVINYHPVISKRAWFTIVIFVLAVAGYALTASPSVKMPVTLPQISTPPLFESINQWFSTVTAGGWQIMHASGLLLPFTALFFALGLHFFIINGFNNSRKNKLDKMYCF